MKIIQSWIFSCLIFIPSISLSYQFTTDFMQGFYWENYPIAMNIFITGEGNLTGLYEIVKQSEQEWEDGAGVDIFSIQNHSSENTPQGNSIRWSKNFEAETGFDQTRTLAITTRIVNGPYIGKSEIILNASLDSLVSNRNNLLKNTILHEMGHVMGLDHSLERAIMQAIVGPIHGLQNDDIDGAIAVTNETMHRQRTGFKIPLRESDKSGTSPVDLASCASIEISDDDDSDGHLSSAIGFILSVLLGLLMMQKAFVFSLKFRLYRL